MKGDKKTRIIRMEGNIGMKEDERRKRELFQMRGNCHKIRLDGLR